ncbi:MAG: hypothetical protein AAF891_06155 [Pseudomonadota bacterium]
MHSRPFVFILLCLLAMVAAGLFGALHNQISFSVGSSYFYDVKFPQFGIHPELPARIGAAQVGWMASWWMGLAMGHPAFVIGLMRSPNGPAFLDHGLRAMGVAIAATTLGAFLGLSYGAIGNINSLVGLLPNPDAFANPEGFVRAALMHEGSYIGGAFGGMLAAIVMWRRTRA